jgi:hypothetical protein
MPSALQMHAVGYRALVLAMHGNISKSLALGWQSPGDNTFDFEQLRRAALPQPSPKEISLT